MSAARRFYSQQIWDLDYPNMFCGRCFIFDVTDKHVVIALPALGQLMRIHITVALSWIARGHLRLIHDPTTG